MHDRDLTGRSAKAEKSDAQPRPERYAKRDTVCVGNPTSIRKRRRGQFEASRLLRSRPVVSLRLEVSAPPVERVVDDHPIAQHLVVIREIGRETKRDGEQPSGLWGQVMSRGVGTADDLGEMLQGRIGEPILVQKGIEGAKFTDVAELDARHVIGDRTGLLGDHQDLIGRHVEKFSVVVDEPIDQPRASNAIDFRAFSRNPLHGQTHMMGPTIDPVCAVERETSLDTIVSSSQPKRYEITMSRMSKREIVTPPTTARWLLLISQLPPKPAYLRVKIWRRLQRLGAISVKNSVYVLPASEQALEDFQWLLREIEQSGGEGMICEANLIDGLSDQELQGLFDAARDADYEEIASHLRTITAAIRRKRKALTEEAPELKTQVAKRRRRFAEVHAIDFFGATGRMIVEGLFSEIETRLDAPDQKEQLGRNNNSVELVGKTWVTRSGVHVDRIACAWLIRRFVDPEARFKFVSVKNYDAESGELRFDMFKAEFTHVGDMCSFEVLLERVGLNDPALRAIAEIVHDIDLKDGKFGREQAAGIAHVIAGICTSRKDDLARVERGSALFDDTYEYFRKKRGR